MANQNESAVVVRGTVSKGILTEESMFNPISFGKGDFTG